MSDPLMPIDLRQLTTGQTGASNQGKAVARDDQRPSSPAKESSQVGSTDSVEVSEKARLVGQLLSDLSAKPEVDSAKVDRIKNAIASGEFTVSADSIAAKILQVDNGLRKLSE